jgi:tetratricopeptide (TPR) repeat protein
MKTLVASILILLSLATAAAQDGRKQFDTLRAEGYEALFNLDYEGARKRFQKMIELAPDHPAGAQSLASSVWLQQLNEAWELKATLYSTDAYAKGKPRTNRTQVEEFRKWIRSAKQLSQARLRKDPRDVEALYFLGAAEGLEAAFAGGVERRFTAALRAGSSSVDHHREVLKVNPDFHDAELTIGLMNYVVGSLPLPVKMLVGTMGVRGSKKRGLEALERVSVEGQWARDIARVLLIDLYKREKRFTDAFEVARQLSEKYPRNYLFRLQMADALVSEILRLRKTKAPNSANQEQQVMNIFASLLRDKTLDRTAIDLINFRLNITRQQLAQR